MRNGSKKGHGLTGGVIAALLFGGVSVLFALWMLDICLGGADGDGLAMVFLALYALVFLAIAGGVTAALVQRWREVKGGEEDESRKY